MIETYLYEQNIHWQGTLYNAGTRREALDDLLKLMDIDHILAISGVRRCGKSFLMKQIINALIEHKIPPENILLVNLELPALAGPADQVFNEIWESFQKIKNPQGRLYLFLDEVQTLPNWEKWVKYQYDLHKGNIKFIVTGSNSQLLSSEFATLLSGRVIEKRLFPFSFRELLRHHGIDSSDPQTLALEKNKVMRFFENLLYNGGMPETLNLEQREVQREIIAAYFDTIIYKDIVPRFSVRQSRLLKDLAVYLVQNVTSIVNINKLAGIFDSNRNSLKEFVSYLESSLLISLFEKFDFSAKKRSLAFKKIYSIDNAFYSLIPLRFSPDNGKLLENLVAVELQRRYSQVFYWKNHNECDFVCFEDNKAVEAIQVCYRLNENNRAREIAGLEAACKYLGLEQGTILTFNQTELQNMPYDVKPVSKWLLTQT